MKPEHIKIGTSYFGCLIKEIDVLAENPRRGGLVFEEKGSEYWADLTTFCLWVTSQQGGTLSASEARKLNFYNRQKSHESRHRVVTEEGVFRRRRGRLVRIPDGWLGKTVHPQTIRKRPAKRWRGRRFKRKVMR